MIGRLRGEVVFKKPPQLMLDVNGVGYELEAPMSTFYELPGEGESVVLFTHLVIRDDAHILFGFHKEAERCLFRALLRVNGVGAKMALAILSGMDGEEFARCVQEGDTAALVRLPGIGKKTAERLIVEMWDRLERLDMPVSTGPIRPQDQGQPQANPVADAVEALIALGYKPNDASRMVRSIEAGNLTSEELIRNALRLAAT